MIAELKDDKLHQQILKSLREFYPLKIDEIVLISTVQNKGKDATIEQIAKSIKELRNKGWIEETVQKASSGEETYRFKITPSGIDHLERVEEGKEQEAPIARHMESRLVETYDRIKTDMESVRLTLEANQKTLDAKMDAVEHRISDHDQVIRTYFVRVIETFGVFVGIFAVVIVVMLSSLNAAVQTGGETLLVVLVAIPIILIVVILTLLLGIRELVLKPPRSS
jgi:DNA-binding PadR family transcriptional regulator